MNSEPRLDRVPPQNIDAERAVLGAMLMPEDNNESIPITLNILATTDFYKISHQKIYEAITILFDKGEKVDLLTTTQALEGLGELEKIGGVSYLDEMIDSVPTAANVEYYAKMVKDEAVRRKLIQATYKTHNRLFDSDEVDDVIIELERVISDINKAQSNGSMRRVKDVIKPTFERIKELSQGNLSLLGLSTGFPDLNNLTSGLQKGELIIVAGRPGMGKSMFVQNITEHVVVNEEKTAVIFSMEMTAEQWVLRMLSSQSGVSFQGIRTGQFADSAWPRLTIAAGKVSQMPLYIEDRGGLTVRDMRMKLSQLRVKEDLSLVVVDYLQLCESEQKTGTRNDQVTMISRGLKSLAMEFDVPVIAVSQLSRKPEGRDPANKRPQLSDLRESGAIEQDADVVIFPYREHYYDKTASFTDVEIIIEKQRNGPQGTIHLYYEPTLMRFKSMAKGNYQ